MGPRLRISRLLLEAIVSIGLVMVAFLGPAVWARLNGQASSDADAFAALFLLFFGVPVALVALGAVARKRGSNRRTVGAGAWDRTFRVKVVNARLVLALGGFLAFLMAALTAYIWVPTLWPGTQVETEGSPITVIVVVGGLLALIAVAIVARKKAEPPIPWLSPGGPTLASGGSWYVGEPSELIAVPNGSGRIHVTFVPNLDFESKGIKASLKATEYWVATQDEREQHGGPRTHGIQTIIELPLALSGPESYQAGVPVEWNLDLTLDGQAPPTCGDTEHLGCRWTLEMAIDEFGHDGPRFVQPILVAQPRDRVNSGAMEMPQFSRYEMASGSDGPIRVDFRVSPAPLDLAAPAVADVVIANSGPAIACKAIRLEVWAQLKVTLEPAFAMEQILWNSDRAGSSLPPGESYIRFQIPALNRTWPDADLPHGWIRGSMRAIVDIPGKRDLRVARDLCLCLDKPRPAAVGLPATATTR
jgi:hypothetical protein